MDTRNPIIQAMDMATATGRRTDRPTVRSTSGAAGAVHAVTTAEATAGMAVAGTVADRMAVAATAAVVHGAAAVVMAGAMGIETGIA